MTKKTKLKDVSESMEIMRAYESWVHETAKPSTLRTLALRLAGEAGEFAQAVGKEEGRNAILLELGDTLYYIVRVASQLNSSLEDVAVMNCKKLIKRYKK